MRKKLPLMGVLLCIIVMLGACDTSREGAKQSAEAFMNTEFYLKDFDQYEKSFGKKIVKSDEAIVTGQLVETLSESGMEKEAAETAADTIIETLQEKTSYQVKVIKEESEQAVVELKIYGLDIEHFQADLQRLSVEKVIELVTAAGIEKVETEADLSQLTSKEDLAKAEKIVNEFNQDSQAINLIVCEAIEKMTTVSKSQTVELTLEPAKEGKKYWQVKEEDQAIADITQALIPSF